MYFERCAQTACLLLAAFCSHGMLPAQSREPQIVSIFPVGGQRGAHFDLQIRGQSLEGTYAAWFDSDDLSAEVKNVQEGRQVTLLVHVAPDARLGNHSLRLLARHGISDAVPLRICAERMDWETGAAHDRADRAQLIHPPVAVSGMVGNKGEVDFYSFDAAQDEELRFEVYTATGLLASAPSGGRIERHPRAFTEPELFLYEQIQSWFDPQRITRLKFNDESTFFYYPEGIPRVFHYFPRLTGRFQKPGRYLVTVAAVDGQGGPDYSYQLRITPRGNSPNQDRWPPSVLAPPDPAAWQERDFARQIRAGRLQELASRAPGSVPNGAVRSVAEAEPDDLTTQAVAAAIPAVLEGSIERPGDVDYFKFRADPGQRLAFEIETPGTLPPHFSPRLGVFNAAGQEILSNVYRKIDGDGDDWVKSIEAKTLFTFEKGGEYYLQIRDLTVQHGSPGFRYRVLIRPQVPHIGEVAAKTLTRQGYGLGTELTEDRINLTAGAIRKLTVLIDKEEGFDGEVAIGVENLPPGVQALPAPGMAGDEFPFPKGAQGQSPETYAKLGTENRERFRPERVMATIVLVAAADAPPNRKLQFVRLTARPLGGVTRGEPIMFQELPMMVVSPVPSKTGEPAAEARPIHVSK